MTADSDAVTSRIRTAMQQNSADEIINGVKDAVIEEVLRLDPNASVERTSYFNHSYMPDLVLEWSDSGRSVDRPIFLRNALRTSVLEDADRLAEREPVVLSLAAGDGNEKSSRRASYRANQTLVTDVASIADLASEEDNGQRRSPLLELVKSSILKGGRGLLTSGEARELKNLSNTSAAADESFNVEALESFGRSADELFRPDAAFSLRRAAELLSLGLSANESADSSEYSEGKLSDSDLRVLLPFLLADERARSRTRLWTEIGSMMSLEQLEEMGATLREIDLSVLVMPNLDTWKAKRAQAAFNAEFSADQPADDTTFRKWQLRDRYIETTVGRWRLMITTDARRLKGRADGLMALWEDVASTLSAFYLDEIELRGVSRSVSVTAERSNDVRGDVELIRRSIDDSFRVANASVRPRSDSVEGASIAVDFPNSTATSNKLEAIRSFLQAANLLTYRYPENFI